MSEHLCVIRNKDNPAEACASQIGHGGKHKFAPTAEVLARVEWDGFKKAERK